MTPDFVLHDWRAEPIAIAVAAAPALGTFLSQSHAGGAPDAAHSRQSTALTWSDVSLVSTVVVTIAGASLAEGARDGALSVGHLRATLVVAEGVLFGTNLTSFPKALAGRCRPYDWDDATHTCNAAAGDDAFRAMWSGHAATAAAGAGAATCLAIRDSGFGWPAVVGIAGEALAATTSVLRVAGGAHSWSDVGIGFGVGNVAGVVMCAIHPSSRTDIVVTPTPTGASFSARF